jgi:hypothetical protein
MDQSPISDINIQDIDESDYKTEKVYLTGDFLINEPSILAVEVDNDDNGPEDPLKYERVEVKLKGSFITRVKVMAKTIYLKNPKLCNDIIERIIKNLFN